MTEKMQNQTQESGFKSLLREGGRFLWWISIMLPFTCFLLWYFSFRSLPLQELLNPLGWVSYTYLLFLAGPMIGLSCLGLGLMRYGKVPEDVVFRRTITVFILLSLLSSLSSWLSAFKKKKGARLFRKSWSLVLFSFLLLNCSFPTKACPGRFVNPITDICWSCLFPITIGPVKVNAGGREDTPNPNQALCLCPRPPIPFPVPGIPVGFWEPARLVDITRTPFCMVNMGGMQLGKSIHHHGIHGGRGEARTKHSFYQVHWYIYPVIYWLELLVDFLCLEQQSFDVAYITELDPLWNADELSFILNPEAILFGNPIAQAACAVDCAATSAGFPMDNLFWCGGCQGSLYPFTGNNAAHLGGVGSSLLLTQRMMAKLHRELLLWGTSGSAALCQKYPLPVIKKTQYKTQMTYPRPTARGPMACNPLGRTEVIWGSGREFPYKGEDFGYLIWRKRNCCIL